MTPKLLTEHRMPGQLWASETVHGYGLLPKSSKYTEAGYYLLPLHIKNCKRALSNAGMIIQQYVSCIGNTGLQWQEATRKIMSLTRNKSFPMMRHLFDAILLPGVWM